MVEKSLRPKARPAFISRRDPNFAPSKEEVAGYDVADLEFRSDMDAIFSKDPIAELGFDTNRMQYDVPEGTINAHYMPDYDPSKGQYYQKVAGGEMILQPDTVHYGPDFGSSKDTIAHETRHRGFFMLRDMAAEDPEYFEEKYGKEAALMLDPNIFNDEFITEIFDNPDATYVEPKTGNTKSIEAYFTEIDPSHLKKLKESGALSGGTTHPELVNKGMSGLRRAAKDILEKRKSSEPKEMAKGGTTMRDQMSMFEEGGLKQEGGMLDEESGNEVPVGSTREEVRDDIDAKLSEGEFVFPADVTRYIGLDKLMQLRQEAKRGLQKMEAMGQMGNSDEATLDDDIPFDMQDLIIVSAEPEENTQKFAGGGMPVDPNTGVYYTGNTGVTMQQPIYQPPNGSVPSIPPMPTVPTQPVPTQPSQTGGYTPLFGTQPQQPASNVSFGNLMGPAEITYKTYVNASGDNILVPFIGDNPMYPIPEGYTLATGLDESGRPTGGTDAAGSVATTTQEQPAPADREDYPSTPVQSEFQKAGSWNMDTSGTDGAALQMWIDEANKINTQGNIAAGIMGAINPLMGAAVWAGNAYSKKQILAQIDAKIAQAGKTSKAGQVAALKKLKEDLESGKNKGILGTIVDKITTALGLKPEEKAAAKKNVTVIAAETNDKVGADGKIIKAKDDDKWVYNPPEGMTDPNGKTSTASLKEAGYTPEQYAAEVQRRITEKRQTVADAAKQIAEAAKEAAKVAASDDAQMQAILSGQTSTTTPKTLAEMQAEAETIAAPTTTTKQQMADIAANAKTKGMELDLSAMQKPKVVTAQDKAASDAAATNLKNKNVTKDTITKEEFEKIKDSEDAKKMFGISPDATTIEEVKQQTTTIPSAVGTSPLSTLGSSLVGAGMELGKSVFDSQEKTSERDDLVEQYISAYLESPDGKNVTDRLLQGEDVTIQEIESYLNKVGQQDTIKDTSTQEAMEKARQIREDEAALRAQEDARRKAEEQAAREAQEKAAKAAQEQAAREAEQRRLQDAAQQAAQNYSAPTGGGNVGDSNDTYQSVYQAEQAAGASAGQAASTASTVQTSGLSKKEKKGGASLDTAMGISGLAKGGLASRKIQKKSGLPNDRGIAARKK